MEYRFINQDQQDDTVAHALISREHEHHNYELNKQNYEHVLKDLGTQGLPDDWPSELVKYKNIQGEALAKDVHGDTYDMVTKLQNRDRIRLLLKTTITEQAKCEGIYNALSLQLSEGPRRDAAISRVLARMQPPQL